MPNPFTVSLKFLSILSKHIMCFLCFVFLKNFSPRTSVLTLGLCADTSSSSSGGLPHFFLEVDFFFQKYMSSFWRSTSLSGFLRKCMGGLFLKACTYESILFTFPTLLIIWLSEPRLGLCSS